MFSTTHYTLNQLWAELLLEELTRRGVRHCCLAPGSRSTPLVTAAAARPQLQLHHHLDERGLGFLALGIAKATDGIVAVITTSGTAVANLYPALIEASLTGARLVLLTADRPERLQNCGANQSINQPGIFAEYPRHAIYLPSPNESCMPAQLLSQLSDGLDVVQTPAGGCLHINCPYDEPLYPSGETQDFSRYLEGISDWCTGERPWRSAAIDQPLPLPDAGRWQAFSQGVGVIVAGDGCDQADADAIRTLAATLGWPVLADIQHPLKFEATCVGLADLLLTQDDARLPLVGCTRLLQFGGRLVSKRLQQFVEKQLWGHYWVVHPGDYPRAPGRNQHRFFAAKAAGWCEAVNGKFPKVAERGSAASILLSLNQQLEQRLARQFARTDALTELSAAYHLLRTAPAESVLMAGNSLSIRLLEMLGGSSDNPLRIVANRGASGIEGLVATAAGYVRAGGQAVTLLLGDTSLLYDLNSLLLLRELPAPLVIVVLNNDGGGIFRLLPVDQSLLQQHYQRPHGLTFADAAAMFDVRYGQPVSVGQFNHQYRDALVQSGSTLIEVCCDAAVTAQSITALTQPLKTG